MNPKKLIPARANVQWSRSLGRSRFGGNPTNRHYSTIHSVMQSYVTKAFHLQEHCGNPTILIAMACYPLQTFPFQLPSPLHPLCTRNHRHLSLFVAFALSHSFKTRARNIPYYVFHSHVTLSHWFVYICVDRLLLVLIIEKKFPKQGKFANSQVEIYNWLGTAPVPPRDFWYWRGAGVIPDSKRLGTGIIPKGNSAGSCLSVLERQFRQYYACTESLCWHYSKM